MIAGSSFLRKQLEPRAPHGVTSGVETLDVSGTPDPSPLLLAHRSATDFGAQISHRTGRWRPRPPYCPGVAVAGWCPLWTGGCGALLTRNGC